MKNLKMTVLTAAILSVSATASAVADPTAGVSDPNCTTCGGGGNPSTPFTVDNTSKVTNTVDANINSTYNPANTNTFAPSNTGGAGGNGTGGAANATVGPINSNNVYKQKRNLTFSTFIANNPASSAADCGVIQETLSASLGGILGGSKSDGSWDEECRKGKNILLKERRLNDLYKDYDMALSTGDQDNIDYVVSQINAVKMQISYAEQDLIGFTLEYQREAEEKNLNEIVIGQNRANAFAKKAGVTAEELRYADFLTRRAIALAANEDHQTAMASKEAAKKARTRAILSVKFNPNKPITSTSMNYSNSMSSDDAKALIKQAKKNAKSHGKCSEPLPFYIGASMRVVDGVTVFCSLESGVSHDGDATKQLRASLKKAGYTSTGSRIQNFNGGNN